jgi:hypothetical protein
MGDLRARPVLPKLPAPNAAHLLGRDSKEDLLVKGPDPKQLLPWRKAKAVEHHHFLPTANH